MAILVLCLIAFLGSVGTGLVVPVLPFVLAETAGNAAAGARALGWLMAVYGACAFLAAPALGRLSDVVGRRPVLLVSTAGSAAGDLILACARTIRAACLGRAVDGVTAGNMGAVNAYVTDAVPEEDRAKAFGRIGALFGIGLITGPAIGAALAALWGARAPLLGAAALAGATTVIGWMALPETAAGRTRRLQLRAGDLNPLVGLRASLVNPPVRRLLWAAVLATAAAVTVQLLVLLVAKDCLGWSAVRVSAMVVAVGVTDIVVQGLLVGPLHDLTGDRGVATLGLGLIALSAAVLGATAVWPVPALAVAGTLAIAAGEGLFSASFAACLSRAAEHGGAGALLGAQQGLQEVTAVVTPVLGTQLYARTGGAVPLGMSAVLAVGALVLLAPRAGARSTRA
ncbi:MAG TPA: MFS transporter [Anaeromyxobacter sp.]|nr:MFS transporter [Anaeromyxobacter sp.]